MSKQDELLRRILEDPDSDELRLEYASVAKQAGDPRGEFIEVQLEEARKHRAHTYVADWAPLAKRGREILAHYDALWLKPLSQLIDDKVIRHPAFYRGFVEDVEIDARAFNDHAALLYQRAPIRHLSLTKVMEHPHALASPRLAQIGTLAMTDEGIDDATIELLARNPHARRLRYLDLGINRLTQRGVEVIAASPHLKGLRYVQLRANDVEDPTDRWAYEGEAITWTEPREAGKALEAKYGRIEWLHAPYEFGIAFPPLVQAAVDP